MAMILENFLTTSFQNVRSSKRTDELHKVLLDEILNANPLWADYDWKFEYQLPVDGFGGTFDIDIAAFDSEGHLTVAILAKAINSNVNKNIKNYANTSIGEAARLWFAPNPVDGETIVGNCCPLEKILFVSVLPRVAPRFNSAGDVAGFDDVVSAKNRTKISDILDEQYHGFVECLDLYFDIDDVKEKNCKADYQEISVSNLDAVPVI